MKEDAEMTEPTPGESRDEYAARRIPEVLKEDASMSSGQAAGKCYGVYDVWEETQGITEE